MQISAKTVYNIQRQGNRLAAMQFDSSQLYKWIRDVSQKVRVCVEGATGNTLYKHN